MAGDLRLYFIECCQCERRHLERIRELEAELDERQGQKRWHKIQARLDRALAKLREKSKVAEV